MTSPDLLERLGVRLPIVQAPMAGVATPALAAAVSEAGALGGISVGAVDAARGRETIRELRRATSRPFAVNVFCHRPARRDAAREAAWIARLAPEFESVGATPPVTLREPYTSFVVDDAMLAMLCEERPAVVSFHFGLPPASSIEALHAAGIVLFASATSVDEARAISDAGVDVLVAQGIEAGGHRGVFDPDAPDDALRTLDLTRRIADAVALPVVAAGGIMDGTGIARSLAAGASMAQLGTAFVACPESAADAAFRKVLLGPSARRTVLTRALSGRPVRCIANRITALGEQVDPVEIPDYPVAYDAAKALHAAASKVGEFGFAAHLAGQGAPLARSMPAAELVATLERELDAVRAESTDPTAA